MKTFFTLFSIFTLILFNTSCKKPEPNDNTIPVVDLTSVILQDVANKVVFEIYSELALRTNMLHQQILELQINTTEQQLVTCKQSWRDTRSSWEQSEAFLFGPVSYDNIDPRIDTWPVNFQDLETELAGSNEFSSEYVNGLQDALKGFHPIEYLLFGIDGAKSANEFTLREKEFLTGLAFNLRTLTAQLAEAWNPTNTASYYHEFKNAGTNSNAYPSQLTAYEEMVNAMIGICDEVANGKMLEPLLNQDPSLEESPFSFNSLTDFTNNIRGVKVMYQCKYLQDGNGLEDLVRKNNLSLDGELKTRMDNAIASLNNITVPFGQAINAQPLQVQLAIDAINELAGAMEDGLLPFVQTHVQ